MGNNGNSFTDSWRNEFIGPWEHSLCLTHRNTATINWHEFTAGWWSMFSVFRNVALTEKKFLVSTPKKEAYFKGTEP